MHGGGWVLGSIDSENAQCSTFTKEAHCVTIAVDYRLAPEHPWPAAVEDSLEALQWLHERGPELLGINREQVTVGGSSAGANLAAILSLHAPALDPPISIVMQLLNVPTVDQTLMPNSELWQQRPHAPWLPSDKMIWYRRLYLPNESDWSHPDASPMLAKKEDLARSPKTLVCVAEQDLLCAEGLAYAEVLRGLGVEVTVKKYAGSTHNLMAADAVLDSGKQLVQDNIDALRKQFQT
jgi:acetyl esterase/lipase